MNEEELDDFADVSIITAMLIGTAKDATIKHAIRIQKMAFLVDKILAQPDLDEEFDFGPDKFGPMSENVENAVDMLIEWGYASQAGNKNGGASLTEDGLDLVNCASKKYPNIHKLCNYLNDNLSVLSNNELVKVVYRLYPEDTVNSLIRDELVNSDKVDSLIIDMKSSGTCEIVSENGTIYSVEINYGVARLEGAGIDA